MFAQAEAALERSHGGLGIGLALSKALIELHDGRIEVASGGPGAGSTFTVRLPALADAPSGETRRQGRGATAPLRCRILIVDDMKDSADSLALLLGAAGHLVQLAYDGESAVAAAETFRPDAVLLDLGMPSLNGYDVCRRIRAQPWGAAMTIVALTGWGQQEDRRRTAEAGFDAHLVKPVEPQALDEALRAGRASAAAGTLAVA
jgi:CheY-like chemotaxis protein